MLGIIWFSSIWNALAQTQAGKSVLGTSAKISRANLYSRLNYWIVFCGGEALSNPPALQGVEAPTEAVVTLTPTKFTFELESEPADFGDDHPGISAITTHLS